MHARVTTRIFTQKCIFIKLTKINELYVGRPKVKTSTGWRLSKLVYKSLNATTR